MAIIKIILDKGESLEEVKEELVKSIKDTPVSDKQFHDPVLEETFQALNKRYVAMYEGMFKEILEIMKLDDLILRQK